MRFRITIHVIPMLREKAFLVVVLSSLTWLLLSLPFATITKAQPKVAVGVNVGDWVTYGDILLTWNSTDLEPDPELVELNSTLWFKNEVLNIKDTTIVFQHTMQFKNKTQKTSAFMLDIYTGKGNDTLMFVASGLSAHYLLYPASISPVWINETTTRNYAGAAREVNHLNIIQTQLAEGDPPNVIHFSTGHYWDKATGVLTERVGLGAYVDPAGSLIASWTRSDKVVETNLWESDEKPDDGQGNGIDGFPYAILSIVAVAVVLVGTWLFWQRRKQFKRRKSRGRR